MHDLIVKEAAKKKIKGWKRKELLTDHNYTYRAYQVILIIRLFLKVEVEPNSFRSQQILRVSEESQRSLRGVSEESQRSLKVASV